MKSRRRGPRRHLRTGAAEGQLRVLMPELLGAVIHAARTRCGLAQAELSARLEVPPPALSKLEKGHTTMSVYHLDRYAEALGEGEDQGSWQGWELYRRASTVADLLADRGYSVWWLAPQRVEEQERLRGRELAEVVRELWEEAAAIEHGEAFDRLVEGQR
jgi:transcriptional regulator with XRE-family HTH domain